MSLDIQKNELHYYDDLLRMRDSEQRSSEQTKLCVRALHNVIRTMRFSRHDKVCGEDFSQLDFGTIPLNGIYFSNDGNNPSSFNRSVVHSHNFIDGHSSFIDAVAYSDDGKLIATGDNIGNLILWNASSGLSLEEWHLGEKINSVIFSSDDNYLHIGLKSTIIRISLFGSKSYYNQEYTLPNANVIAISDNCCALGGEEGLVPICDISDFANDNLPHSFYSFFEENVSAIATTENICVIGSKKGRVFQFDITSELVSEIPNAHNDQILSIELSDDGRTCITVSKDNAVGIWFLEDGKGMRLDTPNGVDAIALSRDGEILCVAFEEGKLHLIHLKTLDVRELSFDSLLMIDSMAFSPDTRDLIINGFEEFKGFTSYVIDTFTAKIRLVFGRCVDCFHFMTFSANNKSAFF